MKIKEADFLAVVKRLVYKMAEIEKEEVEYPTCNLAGRGV